MQSATATPTAELTSGRARPGLALALALLSLPGSTLTWYVIPLGGLLIGLPLALAAIAIGTRARRERGRGRARMATAAVAIAALAIVQMVVYYLVESLA